MRAPLKTTLASWAPSINIIIIIIIIIIISFPAQASDFMLKIFSSMVSDKVYDVIRLTGCSQNILENMQISASIVLQDKF